MLYPYYVMLWGTFGGTSHPSIHPDTSPVTYIRANSIPLPHRNDVYGGPPCPGTCDFFSSLMELGYAMTGEDGRGAR